MFPLARFLNQTATYEELVTVDNRDDPTYSASTVACRFVEVDRRHYGKDEDVRQSRSKVWLLFQPVLRSLINGREIVSATAIVPVGGSIAGWEASLR